MGQIISGKQNLWVTGELVTASDMNAMFSSSRLDKSAIIDQIAIDTPLESSDTLLIIDSSVDALRKITVSELLTSGSAITTSRITGGTDGVMSIEPIYSDKSAGTVPFVASANNDYVYISITSSNTLNIGEFVTIDNCTESKFNGLYVVDSCNNNSFTIIKRFYELNNQSFAESGTLNWQNHSNGDPSYTSKNTVIKSNSSTMQNSFVGKDLLVNEHAWIDRSLSVGWNTNINGDLTVNGDTTQTGTVTVAGNETHNGTVNITGGIKYNGTPVFGLYEIAEETPSWVLSSNDLLWTSSQFTKPVDEIWIFEFLCCFTCGYNGGTAISVANNNEVPYMTQLVPVSASTYTANLTGTFKVLLNSGIAYNNERMKLLSTKPVANSSTYTVDGKTATHKMLIYKYKTAKTPSA